MFSLYYDSVCYILLYAYASTFYLIIMGCHHLLDQSKLESGFFLQIKMKDKIKEENQRVAFSAPTSLPPPFQHNRIYYTALKSDPSVTNKESSSVEPSPVIGFVINTTEDISLPNPNNETQTKNSKSLIGKSISTLPSSSIFSADSSLKPNDSLSNQSSPKILESVTSHHIISNSELEKIDFRTKLNISKRQLSRTDSGSSYSLGTIHENELTATSPVSTSSRKSSAAASFLASLGNYYFF